MAAVERHVLITGGSGFVGANLCVGLAERHPDWEIIGARQPQAPRLGAQPPAPARGRRALRARRRPLARRPAGARPRRRDRRVLGRAERAGRRRRLARLPRAVEPVRRLPLPRARAPRRRAGRVHLDLARLSLRRAGRAAVHARPRRASSSTDGATGVAEDFPLEGARTLYGATKLAAEHLVTEYAAVLGLPTVINRCGVIAGPWQMGKVDQGVFTYWVLAHQTGRPLSLHRLRRRRQAGARPASTSTTSST